MQTVLINSQNVTIIINLHLHMKSLKLITIDLYSEHIYIYGDYIFENFGCYTSKLETYHWS